MNDPTGDAKTLADELLSEAKAQGVVLDIDAADLVRLAARSFIGNNSNIRLKAPLDNDRAALARAVFMSALTEKHVRDRGGETGIGGRFVSRPVSLDALLYAMAISGRKVLGKILDKGF